MSRTPGPGTRSLRKGRFSQRGQAYFITLVTDQRTAWFQEFSFARLMCRNLRKPEWLDDARNLCWVVMPDHVHLLLQVEEAPLHRVMNRLKSRSAKRLNEEIGRKGRFWQKGYYDHALRREESLVGVARYIAANPIRAGLVQNLRDYPYWDAAWLDSAS